MGAAPPRNASSLVIDLPCLEVDNSSQVYWYSVSITFASTMCSLKKADLVKFNHVKHKKKKGRVPYFSWTDKKLMQELGFRTCVCILHRGHTFVLVYFPWSCIGLLFRASLSQILVNSQAVSSVSTKAKEVLFKSRIKIRTVPVDHGRHKECFKACWDMVVQQHGVVDVSLTRIPLLDHDLEPSPMDQELSFFGTFRNR